MCRGVIYDAFLIFVPVGFRLRTRRPLKQLTLTSPAETQGTWKCVCARARVCVCVRARVCAHVGRHSHHVHPAGCPLVSALLSPGRCPGLAGICFRLGGSRPHGLPSVPQRWHQGAAGFGALAVKCLRPGHPLLPPRPLEDKHTRVSAVHFLSPQFISTWQNTQTTSGAACPWGPHGGR